MRSILGRARASEEWWSSMICFLHSQPQALFSGCVCVRVRARARVCVCVAEKSISDVGHPRVCFAWVTSTHMPVEYVIITRTYGSLLRSSWCAP